MSRQITPGEALVLERTSSPVEPVKPLPLWRRLGDLLNAVVPLSVSLRSLSFSQYGEDLLLGVTLLPGREGVYVDVGAYHPWRGSNTYKLYLKGWRGLTIEPNPAHANLFRRFRPRDVHVIGGVSSRSAELEYFEFAENKLNTFCAAHVAFHESQGEAVESRRLIGCRPLQSLIDAHLPGRRIDLLSIDCEGWDLSALQSLNYSKSRPTAILVEDFQAFEKLTHGGRSDIEDFLRERSYRPVGQAMFSTLYVDGLALEARRTGAFDLARCQL